MSEKDLDQTVEKKADESTVKETVKQSPETAEDGQLSVEEAFLRLDELIQELGKPDQTLEASFRSYAEGMKLIQFCNAALDEVEKKVLVLSRDGEVDEF